MIQELDVKTNTLHTWKLKLGFKKLRPDAIIPTKAYAGDAGIDLYTTESVKLPAGKVVTVPIGIAAVIPHGYALVVRDRSSLGSNGVHHLAGVIDAGYRGEIKVSLINLNRPQRVLINDESGKVSGEEVNYITLPAGSKIAQALLIPVPEVTIEEIDDLPDSERGTNGYGSSGA